MIAKLVISELTVVDLVIQVCSLANTLQYIDVCFIVTCMFMHFDMLACASRFGNNFHPGFDLKSELQLLPFNLLFHACNHRQNLTCFIAVPFMVYMYAEICYWIIGNIL